MVPMTAEAVARDAYRAMQAGRPLAIPGLLNRLVAASGAWTPRFVMRPLVAFLLKPPSRPALKA